MAVISSTEQGTIRNGCAAAGITINYTKAQIAAAAQAVEDFLTANATAISTAINTATSPLVLTAAQKKEIVAQVMFVKYMRDK